MIVFGRLSVAFSLAKYSFLAVSAYLLVACASMPLDLHDARLIGLAQTHEIKNIPFYPQVEDQCGPSSLATMLGVQGIDVSPEELRGKLYIPGKEGAVTTEMIARARRFGMLVYPLEPDFIDVLTEVHAGNPVLVMQNLGFNWLPVWHFSVVMAYDLERRKLSLRSGVEYIHEVDFSLFQKTWRRADSWAVVITSPDKLPQTATAEGVINSASELEQVGELKAALQSYQTILDKWPENSIAYFGAGNTAYALGQFQLAAGFFSDFLTIKPSSAIAWNNLAYSLAEHGCLEEAKSAINCALKIDPDSQNLLDSSQEINQFINHEKLVSCELVSCVVD